MEDEELYFLPEKENHPLPELVRQDAKKLDKINPHWT